MGGSGLLRPGTYFTDVFEPQAVFKVGEGWDTRFHGAESLELRFKPEPRDEVIFFDSEQFDLSVERALRQIKTLFAQSTGRRSDFAFGEVPSITPERLGGSAFRIEVRVEQPVSVLLSERNPYQVRPGDQLIVNGIDSGKGTVLIFVEAPGETFERFVPKAAQVLATLRFP